jgi:NAD(P)-dependent dehydrogenase (short-subunit alcohol dehydrogenase family)
MEQRARADAVVLITGAASGIGHATAVRFARAGASLALLDLDAQKLSHLVETLQRQSVPVSSAVADLSVEQAVQDAVRTVLSPYERLDVVFANVGQLLTTGPFESLSLDQWHATCQVNLFAHVATLQACLPYLLKAGGGCVITNCSDQAL